MPKILLAGQDFCLLETRAAVLRKTGAEVVSCGGPAGPQIVNVVASQMPELLVLCHSLLHEEAEKIADKVHACCPKTRVLLVVSPLIADRPSRDTKFDATCLPEPKDLIRCVTELLQKLPYRHVRATTPDGQAIAAD
jgi:hypothetical protein